MNVVSARAAALRILAARQTPAEAPPSTAYTLAGFQQEAVGRALAIMRRRGGVIIADSVGLGKTYIAAALVEQALAAGQTVAVVIPSSLQRMWRRVLKSLTDNGGGTTDLVTHGQLSRGHQAARSYALTVVDEAHAFRNPHTRRYRALRRLARTSQVALLTATPVNNSLSDLYFQIRLFAADDSFADLGIGSLAALLRMAEPDPNALARLGSDVIIRRTRALLRARLSEPGLPDAEHLRFPAVVQLVNVRHPPILTTEEIECFLKSVEFAAYQAEPTRTLMGLSLLKRLQSSRHAALRTLDRLIVFHERFLTALEHGQFLQAKTFARSEEQLCFTEIMLPALPNGVDVRDLATRVRLDLETLGDFRSRVRSAVDAKFPALVELLSARPPPHRTVVFTEFRDTAEHLWRALRHHFQVGLVTGADAYLGNNRASRMEVIHRFAPRANHRKPPGAQESVFVLIATDVLAEGLNLQDADAVVSFDLPWNPVRLIQRAGRIDRLGSGHDHVVVFNFIPDRDFDDLIGLVRRLRLKLRRLRAAVGQEAPVLEPDEVTASFYEELATQPLTDRTGGIVDFSGAAPEGAMASTTSHPKRVLVSWQTGSTVRELTIHGSAVLDDKRQADQIIERALESSHIEAPASIRAAVEASRAYLPTAATPNSPDRGSIILARAIQRAVLRYGFLAGPELLEQADQVLRLIRGNVYDARQLAAIRAARSPQALKNALQEIRLSCRPPDPRAAAEWRLIAAIGCD